MASELARRAAGYETLADHSRELSAELSDLAKELKGDGYHLPAFRLVIKLRRMDRAKARDFLTNFDAYRAELLKNADADLFSQAAE